VGGSAVRIIARLSWALPAILLFLIVHQAYSAFEIRKTLIEGEQARAEVLEFESSSRVEISYDYLSIRVVLADGTEIVKDHMSLPHTLVPVIQGRQELDVRVRPGARQEVVIEEIGSMHWKLALMNMAMSLFGFGLLGAGIFAWNRYLDREGDPGHRVVDESDPRYIAT
jgi:hypothetical protein